MSPLVGPPLPPLPVQGGGRVRQTGERARPKAPIFKRLANIHYFKRLAKHLKMCKRLAKHLLFLNVSQIFKKIKGSPNIYFLKWLTGRFLDRWG